MMRNTGMNMSIDVETDMQRTDGNQDRQRVLISSHLTCTRLHGPARRLAVQLLLTLTHNLLPPTRSPPLIKPYPTRARYSDNNTHNRTPGERNSDDLGPGRRSLRRTRTLQMLRLQEHLLRRGRLYLNRTRSPDRTIMHKVRRTGIHLRHLIHTAPRPRLRPLSLNCNPRRPSLKSSPSQPHLRPQTSPCLPHPIHPAYLSRNVSLRSIRS
jgi:hypothetical protein